MDLLTRRKAATGKSPWVFPGEGRTEHIVEPKKFTARVSKHSGVDFTMHDLRRTFITIAESLDIPHYALKRLLNHRISGDVTGGYIVIDAERLRGPVEKVAEQVVKLAKVDASGAPLPVAPAEAEADPDSLGQDMTPTLEELSAVA